MTALRLAARERALPVGALLALAAALLFGLVNVAAKASAMHPLLKGGLAYIVAGLALAPLLRGARIRRADHARVAAMALVGGAVAPALLFFGLDEVTAVSASLLLTLEMVFTALLAAAFLGERTRGVALAGLVALLLAALLAALAAGSSPGRTGLRGALLVAGAALAWGVDNALSARLVGAYRPHHLIALKGLIGGGTALGLALLVGARPTWGIADVGSVLFIGLLGIGASAVLFYHALRRIGATRTSALFLPTTSLAGVAGGAILLREPVGLLHAVAAGLVVAGTFLVAREPPASAAAPAATR